MEKQSHTPGPWAIEDPMGPENLWIIQGEKPTHEWWPIAVCNMPGEEDQHFSGKEVHANARVIAAAPDLLALLKRALPILQHAINRDPVGVWGDAAIKLEHDALAAIAKAEGRA